MCFHLGFCSEPVNEFPKSFHTQPASQLPQWLSSCHCPSVHSHSALRLPHTINLGTPEPSHTRVPRTLESLAHSSPSDKNVLSTGFCAPRSLTPSLMYHVIREASLYTLSVPISPPVLFSYFLLPQSSYHERTCCALIYSLTVSAMGVRAVTAGMTPTCSWLLPQHLARPGETPVLLQALVMVTAHLYLIKITHFRDKRHYKLSVPCGKTLNGEDMKN